MPQMSPMSWLILFLYFTILFLFFNILNFFNFIFVNKKNLNEENIKKSNIKNFLNWKW